MPIPKTTTNQCSVNEDRRGVFNLLTFVIAFTRKNQDVKNARQHHKFQSSRYATIKHHTSNYRPNYLLLLEKMLCKPKTP